MSYVIGAKMGKVNLNLNKSQLKEGQPTKAEAGGKSMALVLHGGKVYAINSVCTHEGGPLDEGSVDGDEIVCPWHAGAYNIMTGKANEKTNWVHDTETYKIEVDAKGNLWAII